MFTFQYFFSLYEVYEHTEESNLKYGLRSGGEIVMDRLTFRLISNKDYVFSFDFKSNNKSIDVWWQIASWKTPKLDYNFIIPFII